jgi:hypothetical protein
LSSMPCAEPILPPLIINHRVWMTALVCAFFENKLKDMREVWEAAVEKGRKYVDESTDPDMIFGLWSAANQAIKHSGKLYGTITTRDIWDEGHFDGVLFACQGWM